MGIRLGPEMQFVSRCDWLRVVCLPAPLGICVYDFRSHKVVHWSVDSLVPKGKHRPRDNVRYVTDWVSHNRHWFDNAFALVIEQQMRVNMRIIAAVIETLFFNYSKVHVIPPRHVKVHYGLSTGQYATNKKAAVDWVTLWVRENGRTAVLRECEREWDRARKRDDLADSLLLVLYYLDTFSNQLVDHITPI